jgi:hypothetical protein
MCGASHFHVGRTPCGAHPMWVASQVGRIPSATRFIWGILKWVYGEPFVGRTPLWAHPAWGTSQVGRTSCVSRLMWGALQVGRAPCGTYFTWGTLLVWHIPWAQWLCAHIMRCKSHVGRISCGVSSGVYLVGGYVVGRIPCGPYLMGGVCWGASNGAYLMGGALWGASQVGRTSWGARSGAHLMWGVPHGGCVEASMP